MTTLAQSKLVLALAPPLFGFFAIADVDAASDVPEKVASVVRVRHAAIEEPPIDAPQLLFDDLREHAFELVGINRLREVMTDSRVGR